MKRIIFSILIVLSLLTLTGCVMRVIEPGIYRTIDVPATYYLQAYPYYDYDYNYYGRTHYYNPPINYNPPRGVWYPWGNMKNDDRRKHHDTRDGRKGGGGR